MDITSKLCWEQWDDKHSEPEQVKRQERALGKKLTPLTIDHDNSSGTFKGSSGQYVTTLSNCTCTDFSRRKLPCKHMYRLAQALGIYQLSDSVNESTTPPLNKNEAIELIQSTLSKNEQLIFKDFCYTCGNNNAGEALYSSPFADKLISLNLASEVTQPEILLNHLQMNLIRKFLPQGVKSPRTKKELIALVAPLVTKSDIAFPDNKKCITLHSSIAHLGRTLHRKLYELYPHEPEVIDNVDDLILLALKQNLNKILGEEPDE